MKKEILHSFTAAGVLLLLFGLFTVAVSVVDVQPIGPLQSMIGFAGINGYVFQLFGENQFWYHLTEGVGIVAVLLACGFALNGLWQLVKRKRISEVDKDIIALGFIYAIAIATYLLFEIGIINYRPVLVDGVLEASYPSSHTMVVLCILGTAIIRFHYKIKNKAAGLAIKLVLSGFILVTAAGRLISGMHWFTDIVGGILLGASLTMLYAFAVQYIRYRYRE